MNLTHLLVPEQWKIFTSTFHDKKTKMFLNDEDYLKISNLLVQLLKYVFHLNYELNINDIIVKDKITCHQYDQNIKNEKFYCIEIPIVTKLFKISFSFNFNKIENHYVFNNCKFLVYNDFLKTLIPLKNYEDYISAICFFVENQKYDKSIMTYEQSVHHLDIHNDEDSEFPVMKYIFDINKESIDLRLEYYSKNKDAFNGYNYGNNCFLLTKNDISDDYLIRLNMFNTLINCSSLSVLESQFTEINEEFFKDPSLVKVFFERFMDSSEDIMDKIVVLEMFSN